MNRQYHTRRHPPDRNLLRNALFVGGSLLLILLVIFLLGATEEPAAPETHGDIDERFRPATTVEQDGVTYAHQDFDYVTFLIIGIDQTTLKSSSFRTRGQADFLLLATIDRSKRELHMLQIDRDTITPVQVYGTLGNKAGKRPLQICLAYSFLQDPDAAAENTVAAVSELLDGITIDHYIVVDMGGMTALNDALGGVTVTLEDDLSSLDPAMVPGATLTLKGNQAEYYLRGRMNVGTGTNAGRMQRQTNFVRQAVSLVNTRFSEDLTFGATLLKQLEPHLLMNCQQDWLADQIYSAREYTLYDPVSLDGKHVLGENGFVEFYPDSYALTTYVIDHFFK